MKLFQALRLKVPRLCLYFLSIEKITNLKNQIVQLYLLPDQALRILSPKNSLNCYWIDIRCIGGIPSFYYHADGHYYMAWLKCPKNRPPYFDLKTDTGEVEKTTFKDKRCRIVAKALSHLSHYCPFYPTDNFLEAVDG